MKYKDCTIVSFIPFKNSKLICKLLFDILVDTLDISENSRQCTKFRNGSEKKSIVNEMTPCPVIVFLSALKFIWKTLVSILWTIM